MKSALALLLGAAVSSATITMTDVVYEVVTVTVTADPTDFVQASKPTSTATPEPVATSVAPSPPPPPPSPPAANNAAAQEPETTVAPVPTPAPVVVETPQPQPETTQEAAPAQTENLAPSGSYQQTAADYHNAYRKDHGADALEWDETLAQYALNTANSCKFEHDMTEGEGHYGQNLASFGASDDLGTSEQAVAKAVGQQWYKGEVDHFTWYGASNPPSGAPFNAFGHYTQLVWKSSKKFGCVSVKCPAGTVLSYPSYFTVCNYSPPGNFDGQYGQNVAPSLGIKINLST